MDLNDAIYGRRAVRDFTAEPVDDKGLRQLIDGTSAAAASHHFESLLSNSVFDIFYHAPALIVISAEAESPWAVEDCSLAAENMMLAPCAADLGTCWIGFAQAWLVTPDGKAALNLANTNVPIAPIIVGHLKSTAAPVPEKLRRLIGFHRRSTYRCSSNSGQLNTTATASLSKAPLLRMT
jgi:nitroreductase